MTRLTIATIAFGTALAIAGILQAAWAAHMIRAGHARRRYFQQLLLDPDSVGCISDDPDHQAANRALDRLRPWDIASRVLLVTAAYYLGVIVLTT
ncbi:hypothetical protein ACIRPQ_29260 [Streptomyces sp. NPDC101213]|uniref:hypothetical protein n=1 Tax=Streptomyces sp. NPDC101213 TaxID=3366130 RepID=UPI0037F80372